MKSPHDHAVGLLRKAANDLVAAQATIATGRALDAVCFHAQQAAEKSLKALLALKDVAYPWRHDLGELTELTRRLYPGVADMAEEIVSLSPYAVEARYDEAWAPQIDEARAALEIASRAYSFAQPIVGADPLGEGR